MSTPMKKKISTLVKKMTLEEKASLCSGLDFWNTRGIERLEIPSMLMTDGPHGVRLATTTDTTEHFKSFPSTCFPTACAMAATWNVDLVETIGDAIGQECTALGVDLLLGPGVNLKRSPLGGRNFEYYSEDPYLTARMGAAFVKGVQSHGVGACVKHYVCNETEYHRFSISSDVDERTLREVYLQPFETIVKEAKPWAVMSSYNRVNGVTMSENDYLLRTILRDEWGFDGFIVSDWIAVENIPATIGSGLDLDMPGGMEFKTQAIVEAVHSGKVSEATLDERVARLLSVIFRTRSARGLAKETFDKEKHHELARRAAGEAMILLKNDGPILPLNANKLKNVAIIGKYASEHSYEGGGSSQINPTKVVAPLEGVRAALGSGVSVIYEDGYDIGSRNADDKQIQKAVKVARKSDAVIVFVAIPETEGKDKTDIDLPESQAKLVEAVLRANKNTVIVILSGSAVAMPWIHGAHAVIQAWTAGQAYGEALADIIFGHACPSGKLSQTFPNHLRDNPSYLTYPGENDHVCYAEGIFVGHRYYERLGIKPLFPFGYGLSYTTFAYENIRLSAKTVETGMAMDVKVEVDIKNTGKRAGKEVVQLYIRDVEAQVMRPEKALRGFAKVALEPGETKTVAFALVRRDFAYYRTDKRDWYVETGDFEILVGSSSTDARLRDTLTVVHSKTDEDAMVYDLLPTSPLKDWYTHPKGKAIVDKYLAFFIATPLFAMLQEITLLSLSKRLPILLSAEDLDKMVADVRR